MLKGINLLEYTFQDGSLVFKSMVSKEVKKVSKLNLIKQYRLTFNCL